MRTPDWLKPGIYGAACGAIVAAFVGFTWGGWVTSATAREMASKQLVSALTTVCVDHAKRDPDTVQRMAAIKAASSWTRGDLVAKNGWATLPGETAANQEVANACASKLDV